MSTLFFMHIPKAAGTSVRTALDAAIGARLVLAYPGNPRFDLDATLTAPLPERAVVFGHYNWGLHFLFRQEPRYATILRDPVQRIWSWYRYMRSVETFPFYEAAQEMSVGEMVRTGNVQLNNHMTAMLAGRPVRGPNDGEALGMALDHLGRFEWVGLHTEVSRMSAALSAIVGADLGPIPSLNATPGAEMPPEDAKIVRQHNELDLAVFRYGLDLIRIRRAAAMHTRDTAQLGATARPAAMNLS